MLTARDIMTRDVVTVAPGDPVGKAARLLLERRVNGLPVVAEGGGLVGIICQSDLISQQQRFPLPSVFNLLDGLIPLASEKKLEREVAKIAAATVADAMTENPVTISPGATLEDMAALMVKKNFHTLPVVEGGRLVGVVGKEDVLRTLVPAGA